MIIIMMQLRTTPSTLAKPLLYPLTLGGDSSCSNLTRDPLHTLGNHGAFKHRSWLWYSVCDNGRGQCAAVRRKVATDSQEVPNQRQKAF